LLAVLEVAPGTVVSEPGTVLAVSEGAVVEPDPTGGTVASGPAPSPEPRKKKKAMMKMASKAMIRARSLAWAGEAGWR
jgi:hypothetical protein